jgi:hypothetical protein
VAGNQVCSMTLRWRFYDNGIFNWGYLLEKRDSQDPNVMRVVGEVHRNRVYGSAGYNRMDTRWIGKQIHNEHASYLGEFPSLKAAKRAVLHVEITLTIADATKRLSAKCRVE